MIKLPEDRRPPLTPQLALRVAIIGGFALTMFAIIFFRLWYLQVLSGQQYAKAASINFVRKVDVPAQRGEILDRYGNVLVDSRPSLNVVLSPPDLPTPANLDQPLHPRPARHAPIPAARPRRGMSMRPKPCRVGGKVYSLAVIPCEIATKVYQLPYANVTIKRDVSRYVQYYLAERLNLFRGVNVEKVYLRSYPLHDLAAQLFGTIGPINATGGQGDQASRASPRTRSSASPGSNPRMTATCAGTTGRNGSRSTRSASSSAISPGRRRSPGTTCSCRSTSTCSRSARRRCSSRSARIPRRRRGVRGDEPGQRPDLRDGLAADLRPEHLHQAVSESEYNALTTPASGFPLLNRAIQSAGPTGSTFKPITATAALESGLWRSATRTTTPASSASRGTAALPAQRRPRGQRCARPRQRDPGLRRRVLLQPRRADRTRSDHRIRTAAPLQHGRTIRDRSPTGVDLPDEATGTLPTPMARSSEQEGGRMR